MVYASNALYDLRMELGLVEEYPVLVTTDQFNVLYWPSCFYARGEHVPAYNLIVPSSFRSLESSGEVVDSLQIKNGINLCATTVRLLLSCYIY